MNKALHKGQNVFPNNINSDIDMVHFLMPTPVKIY